VQEAAGTSARSFFLADWDITTHFKHGRPIRTVRVCEEVGDGVNCRFFAPATCFFLTFWWSFGIVIIEVADNSSVVLTTSKGVDEKHSGCGG
jgi:hypothetical protein